MWDGRPLFGTMSVSGVVHRETNGRLAMMLRIIHGKLKPGTWESYERAYKEVTAKAGKIPGLKGRWLAHAVDDPDAGYTMSLDARVRKQRGPAADNFAAPEALFLGRLHYDAVRGSVRGGVRLISLPLK